MTVSGQPRGMKKARSAAVARAPPPPPLSPPPTPPPEPPLPPLPPTGSSTTDLNDRSDCIRGACVELCVERGGLCAGGARPVPPPVVGPGGPCRITLTMMRWKTRQRKDSTVFGATSNLCKHAQTSPDELTPPTTLRSSTPTLSVAWNPNMEGGGRRIAVVGSGISGLSAAWLLHK